MLLSSDNGLLRYEVKNIHKTRIIYYNKKGGGWCPVLRLPSLIDLFSISQCKNHAAVAGDFNLNPVTYSTYFRSSRFPDAKVYSVLQENIIRQLQTLFNLDKEKLLQVINKSYLEERTLRHIYISSLKVEGAFRKISYQIFSAYCNYNRKSINKDTFTKDDAQQLLYDLILQRDNRILVSRYLLHRIESWDGYECTEYRRLSADILKSNKKYFSGPLPIGKKADSGFFKSGLIEEGHINQKVLNENKIEVPDKIIELERSTSIDVFMSFVLEHELHVNLKGEVNIICDAKFSEAPQSARYDINVGEPTLDD